MVPSQDFRYFLFNWASGSALSVTMIGSERGEHAGASGVEPHKVPAHVLYVEKKKWPWNTPWIISTAEHEVLCR